MSANEPREYDAVLGGQNFPPINAAVLGGIAGVKQRLASPSVEARRAAISDAIIYVEEGIEAAIAMFDDADELVRAIAAAMFGAQEQLILLKKGAAIWNKWRVQNLLLFGGFVDLSWGDFSGVNVGKANLRQSNLAAANFASANLRGAKIFQSNLELTNLTNADLSEANLSRSNLSDADLPAANLSGANLRSVNFRNANLSQSILKKAKLCGADLSGANLTGADLSGADLSGAKLGEAKLAGANLAGIKLIRANLYGWDFNRFVLTKANLRWSKFARTCFQGADLRGANLEKNDLTNADISGADLTEANLCDANFSKANLSNANLSGAVAKRANFLQANLSGANFNGLFALVTGARVKIGYAVTLRLLRSGAAVICTTRFARDAARRYAKEADFAQWCDRLQVYELDLRYIAGVERFAEHLACCYPRIDIIINNAAQTIRRPPEFYQHLRDFESLPFEALPAEIQPLLAPSHFLRDNISEDIPKSLTDSVPNRNSEIPTVFNLDRENQLSHS